MAWPGRPETAFRPVPRVDSGFSGSPTVRCHWSSLGAAGVPRFVELGFTGIGGSLHATLTRRTARGARRRRFEPPARSGPAGRHVWPEQWLTLFPSGGPGLVEHGEVDQVGGAGLPAVHDDRHVAGRGLGAQFGHRPGRSARATVRYVRPSVERSTRAGRARPPDQVSRTRVTVCTPPRSTTIRPVGPGRQGGFPGEPSTAARRRRHAAGSGGWERWYGRGPGRRWRDRATGHGERPGSAGRHRTVVDHEPDRTVTGAGRSAGALTGGGASRDRVPVPIGAAPSTCDAGGSTPRVPPVG